MKNVVIISAHPDDEVLGAGGTILRHKSKGDNIFWIIATSIYEKDGFSKERIAQRQSEINEVAEKLGIHKTYQLGYPTMSLSSQLLIELVPDISEIFTKVEPNIIYTVNRSDAHSDHRVLFEGVAACTKSFRYPFIEQVLMYECISETEFAPALPEKAFIPNCFVDISDFIEEKMKIMEIYQSEISDHPFPRSLSNIRALAHFRGASNGFQYAEAFQMIKYLIK